MVSLAFFTLVLFVCCSISLTNAQSEPGQCCEEYCFDTDPEKQQTGRFATKSAYRIIKGTDTKGQFFVPNCNPVKFWFVSRHGSRLPTSRAMNDLRELEDLRDEIIDNYEKRGTKPDKGALCDEDIDVLKHWRYDPNITSDYTEFLTSQGWQDHFTLAKTYQNVFPRVLENIYSPEKFRFRHTHIQRTEASYKAFVAGLFGDEAWEHIQVPPKTETDLLLKPHESCQAYKRNEERQAGPESEYQKFMNSDTYKQTIYEISTRLGFKYVLNPKQIKSIWDMCRFDLSWTLDRPSPWCVAFTANNVRVLEYYEDLNYYYKDSYGFGLAAKLPCQLVVDMLNNLESQANPKVVGYFSNSPVIAQFLTALGAFKDNESIRADNYQQMNRRKWRTSEVIPFASNLAVIKYDCPHDSERNKIMFLLNQKPLDFQWCNVGLCDWSKVQQMYRSYKEHDCLTTYCTGGGASNIVPAVTLLLMTVAGSIFQFVV